MLVQQFPLKIWWNKGGFWGFFLIKTAQKFLLNQYILLFLEVFIHFYPLYCCNLHNFFPIHFTSRNLLPIFSETYPFSQLYLHKRVLTAPIHCIPIILSYEELFSCIQPSYPKTTAGL